MSQSKSSPGELESTATSLGGWLVWAIFPNGRTFQADELVEISHIHACMHTYIHTYRHPYMFACIHTCIHTCTHAYIHSHTYIRCDVAYTTLLHYMHAACIPRHILTYVRTYERTHKHTNIQAYMHTNIHSFLYTYITTLLH